MSIPLRRLVLACLLALPLLPGLSASALASGGGGGKSLDIFTKMPAIIVEFWDQQGAFHVMNCEMTAVFREPPAMNKKIGEKITQVLSAMPWEEFSRGNPAATIKAVAIDLLRQDPGTAKVREVLITKMLVR